jgi:hypothetical protein
MKFNEKIEVLHQLYVEGELSAERFIDIVRCWSEEYQTPPIYSGRCPDDETGANDVVPTFNTDWEQGGWTLTYDDETGTSTNEKFSYGITIDPEEMHKIWVELIEERTCTSS